MSAYPPDWRARMARERASLARADRSELADAMTVEHHAAADTSGLPGVKRHRGHVLPDWAPERWEVES